jgi:hypothetical protein
MKGLVMEIEWRTIQMFVGEEGVSEVSVDNDNPNKFRCTCSSFMSVGRCKHTKFMRNKLKNGASKVSITIPDSVDTDELESIFNDVDAFRDFVIKYGSVEYL